MASPHGEHAINDALQHGRALLKFISPNDAGLTGSHQCGFYLPLGAWEMFTPQPPEDGDNHKHIVEVLWQDGVVTESAVTWYGRGTRHEYRLTRFGRDFPFLNADAVGNLLVLIPVSLTNFRAYVLELEEDIDELQVALGVEVIGTWGVYELGRDHIETESECVNRQFKEFAGLVDGFPSGDEFSAKTREALIDCIDRFTAQAADRKLLKAVESEYALFRLIERRFCEPQIHRMFETVDDFLKTAASIMNRRKSRAGRSFENHVGYVLEDAGIPFTAQPAIDGKPDIVIPSVEAYHDDSYPVDKLFIVGLKTTCKDRWRQVLNEGQKVPRKHLMTLQKGISANQLGEMAQADVSLIVPQALHRDYPRDSAMQLQGVEGFIDTVKQTIEL